MNVSKLAIDLIKEQISDAEIHMTNFPGGGSHEHVGLMVVSNEFEGLSLLDQHRKVMDALSDALKKEIHAVKIKTMTKKEYEEKYQ